MSVENLLRDSLVPEIQNDPRTFKMFEDLRDIRNMDLNNPEDVSRPKISVFGRDTVLSVDTDFRDPGGLKVLLINFISLHLYILSQDFIRKNHPQEDSSCLLGLSFRLGAEIYANCLSSRGTSWEEVLAS